MHGACTLYEPSALTCTGLFLVYLLSNCDDFLHEGFFCMLLQFHQVCTHNYISMCVHGACTMYGPSTLAGTGSHSAIYYPIVIFCMWASFVSFSRFTKCLPTIGPLCMQGVCTLYEPSSLMCTGLLLIYLLSDCDFLHEGFFCMLLQFHQVCTHNYISVHAWCVHSAYIIY